MDKPGTLELFEPMEFFDASNSNSSEDPSAGWWKSNFIKPASTKVELLEWLSLPKSPVEDDVTNTEQNQLASKTVTSLPPTPILSQMQATQELHPAFDMVDEPIYEAEQKPTPYSTARKFMQQNNLKVVRTQLYGFNGLCYRRLSSTETQRMIVEQCRRDIELAGTPGHARSVYDLLIIEPKLTHNALEVNPRVVSLCNGMLSLDSRQLLTHSAAYFVTYFLRCNYLGNRGDLYCPAFDSFLCQVSGGDPALIERLWQMIGYILTPDMGGKVFFVLQGVPSSGKSVLTTFISSFFSEDAVVTLDAHALSERFSVSELDGKALCLSPDMPSDPLDVKAVSKLKQLSGSDIVSSDVKYRDRVQFRCTAKLLLATNHPILTKQKDDAFLERVVVVPFSYSVPKEARDPLLMERFNSERDVIATKAILAYFRLVEQRYKFSGQYVLNSVCMNANQEKGTSTDIAAVVFTFTQSCFTADADSEVFTEDAYNAFVDRYGFVSMNIFSRYFYEYAGCLYGAVQGRKRRPGGKNPRYCVVGLRFNNMEEPK